MPLIPQTERSLAKIDAIDSVLADTGYVAPESKERSQLQAKTILDNQGADIRSVLGNMVQLMNNAENEAVRLKATENALVIHGVSLKEQGHATNNQINIIFKDVNNGDARLDAVLCPQR